MSIYGACNLSGSSWQRAFRIVIGNPLGAEPSIAYAEERVIVPEDGLEPIRQYTGEVSGQVNLSGEIALRDPDTLEPTGQTMPLATVYLALLSDYINRAEARDAQMNGPVPVDEP